MATVMLRLSLLTLLATVGYALECSKDEFQCETWKCLPNQTKCNGLDDCPNGSDEEPSACNARNTTLRRREKQHVHLTCNSSTVDIEFLLCNKSMCNKLRLEAFPETVDLVCKYGSSCNTFGYNCKANYIRTISNFPFGTWSCPGNFIFEVQLFPFELIISLQQHADKEIILPALYDFDRLWVRTKDWSDNKNLQILMPCQRREIPCHNGQCIPVDFKCNGTAECSDGSDEWTTVCSAGNTTLFVWDTITATFHHEVAHDGVDFQLCNATDCTALRLLPESIHDPSGTYQVRTTWYVVVPFLVMTGCNLEGSQCLHTKEVTRTLPAWTGWSLRNRHSFDIEHREFDLAVWPSGFPHEVFTVPAPRDHSFFRIRPERWEPDMPVKFRGARGHPVGHGECGQRTPPLEPTIVGGQTVVQPSEFPWHVMVYKAQKAICGGSLISPRFTISAGHCFAALSGKALDARFFQAAVGKVTSTINSSREAYTQIVNVGRIHIHENFKGGQMWFLHDIAVVELAVDVQLSPSVMPICVDWDAMETPLRANESITVVGLGLGRWRVSEQLSTANLTFLSLEDCTKDVTGQYATQVAIQDKFCVGAGHEGNATLARGDSGGSMAALRSNRWFLVGVVSANYVSRSFATNVTTYIPWLRNVIRTYSTRSN